MTVEEESSMAEIRRSNKIWLMLAIAASVYFILMPTAFVNAQRYDMNLYAGLRWRMVGPFRAGRVNAVSGVAGQPDTFYFGSVGGGVWKSMNSGRTWTPLFDANPRQLERSVLLLRTRTLSTWVPAKRTCATRSGLATASTNQSTRANLPG